MIGLLFSTGLWIAGIGILAICILSIITSEPDWLLCIVTCLVCIGMIATGIVWFIKSFKSEFFKK